MRGNASFRRKIIYLSLMALLLVPLSYISRPSSVDTSGTFKEGGILSQQRTKYNLAQASLGDIDPASESMKLATLGMRGVAANILWEKAINYQKKEDWDNLKATLNQIAKLQPNFISVWKYQAWNLSYNVSVEFDNYKHRYHWVKKGIEFLMEGIRYNRNEPRLLWDLGWFFGHKIGRSDEYRQFRREYREDRDFHDSLTVPNRDETYGVDDKPDNWLTARQWFLEAQRVVEKENVPIRGQNPLVFHSDPPKTLIRYAEAMEEDGYFDQRAALAWANADQDWKKYGDRDIPTSYGYMIHLNDQEQWEQRVASRNQQLDDLLPGLRASLEQDRRASLTDRERDLVERGKLRWGPDEFSEGGLAVDKATVTVEDIVAAAPVEKKVEARRLSSQINEANSYSTTVRRYRDVVNFIYWRTRCEVEQTDQALQGREFLFSAGQALDAARLEDAKRFYEACWDRWSKIHAEHPELADDVTSEDLVDAIKRYSTLMGQMDEPFPPPGFKMLDLVLAHKEDFSLTDEQIAIARSAPPKDAEADERPGDDDSTHN